jgi:hypothetical protein
MSTLWASSSISLGSMREDITSGASIRPPR